MPLLPREFYTRDDVVQVARELLGKYLYTRIKGIVTSGIITETEAYAGITDRASHAYGGRRTERTEIMYRIGGTAYIYLCYGFHSLFNIVTNREDIPHAVLIRGIKPVEGIPVMLERSGKIKISPGLSDGPGKVSKILGIHYNQSGLDLTAPAKHKKQPSIWLEDHGFTPSGDNIKVGTRIGVDYSGEDTLRPYRFILLQ